MKKITVLNPNHPRNMMNARGQQAKKMARKLSNQALDTFLIKNIEDQVLLGEVIAYTRSRKINFIRCCAMVGFAKAWNESQSEKQEASVVEAKVPWYYFLVGLWNRLFKRKRGK